MSAVPILYFSEQMLRTRFNQDIDEAYEAGDVSFLTREWLRALVESTQSTEIPPRVDQLLLGDGPAVSADLASAFIISDVARPAGPMYLSTITFGIKEYATRDALLSALRKQFPEVAESPREIELEHVTDDPFTRRMERVLEQQVAHLDLLAQKLHETPTLQKAVGKAYQAELLKLEPASSLDVFTHLVQVVKPRTSDDRTSTVSVLTTRTLAEAAYQLFVDQPLEDGLSWQFLDDKGNIFAASQAAGYLSALASVDDQVPAVYEQLLSDYWSSPYDDWRTMRQAGADALADAYRQNLLKMRADKALDQAAYGRLRRLLAADDGKAQIPGLTVETISVDIAGHSLIKLSGMVLLECTGPGGPSLYLFSAAHGLARVKDRQHLGTYLTEPRNRSVLLTHASVIERRKLDTLQGPVTLKYETIGLPVFDTLMSDVIDMQKRNLRHVLDLPGASYSQSPVRVDDALDIRTHLDRRLLESDESWRWTAESTDFQMRWGPVDLTSGQSNDRHLLFETWADQVDKLDSLVNQTAELHQGVEAVVCQELNRYLAVTGERGIDARSLWIGRGGGSVMMRLPFFVLESITGARSAKIPAGWTVQRKTEGHHSRRGELPVGLLRQIVRRVVEQFPARYAERLRSFYKTPLRHGDMQFSPAATSGQVREQALRLEVVIERRLNKIGVFALDMIEQALDRPTAALQRAFGQDHVKLSSVALSFDSQQPAIALRNVFVLSQPDKADRLTLWAAGTGIVDFDSLSSLEVRLATRLTRTDDNEPVLALMSDADRTRLESHLEHTPKPVIRVVLSDLRGSLLDALQAQETERQVLNAQDALQDAAAWHLSAEDVSNMLYICERDDVNRRTLDALRNAIRVIVGMTIVPDWVLKASLINQDRLLAAMLRFYMACGLSESFLFDIPMLKHYARRRLQQRLDVDFPKLLLDPGDINLVMTRYVVAPGPVGALPQMLPAATESVSGNLVDYALNRFYNEQGTLSVEMADGSAVAPGLTATYLRDLVGDLDLGQDYLTLLAATFREDSPGYAKRRKLFALQLPALDMLRALSLYMEGELSEGAWRLIGSILEMPDALARLTIKGQYATISPLRLKPAESGWDPAVVLGAYVIAPEDQDSGPWVLYTLLGDFVFKEYPDKAALLNDIRTSSTLQTFLLDRIDEDQRKIYDHGGFLEPHLPFSAESDFDLPAPVGPVTLDITPFQGNALELLLKDMFSCYLWSVRKVVITNEQQQRSSSRYLFWLGVEQTLAFLPGRLGALVGVWQSGQLFSASATAAGEQEWGKAFSQFTAAVGTLIATRRAGGEEAVAESSDAEHSAKISEGSPESGAELGDPADLEFSWRNGGITPEMRNRLRAFEAHDVTLNQLSKNELNSTYSDDKGRIYAAIGGSVYAIEKDQDQWFIVGEHVRGPAVRLGANQKWELDVGGLKGGGGSGSSLKGAAVDVEVNEIIQVEARGMGEIRSRSPSSATAIEQGHAQARYYLENCMDNLTESASTKSIHPKAQRIIDDFFSQHIPDATLYVSVRQAILKLYRDLMHPSLSPLDSQRYAIGTNLRWHEPTSAFTFQNDPLQRIFFTEKFFRVPVYRLKTRVIRLGSFNVASHHYAAILLHELTHLVLNTDDIAYLEANAPFIDLLEDSSAYRMTVKNELLEAQQRVLSYDTDRSRLFKQVEDGIWRDLRHRDGDAKQTVLSITGAKTLEEARDVFYADQKKRAALMMSNADSVALLITLLGRERFNPRP